MISIAIINLKGGVGKSVTACNLAAELAVLSKSVLVVDLDKQGNTSKFFGVLDYDRPSVAEVMLGECRVWDAVVEDTGVVGVHLLPCDMRMLKANRGILMVHLRSPELVPPRDGVAGSRPPAGSGRQRQVHRCKRRAGPQGLRRQGLQAADPVHQAHRGLIRRAPHGIRHCGGS